jgi:hypothetical protein
MFKYSCKRDNKDKEVEDTEKKGLVISKDS